MAKLSEALETGHRPKLLRQWFAEHDDELADLDIELSREDHVPYGTIMLALANAYDDFDYTYSQFKEFLAQRRRGEV